MRDFDLIGNALLAETSTGGGPFISSNFEAGYSSRAIGSSIAAIADLPFTKACMSCGSAILTFSSGAAMVTSGGAAPLGGVLVFSGALGIAACPAKIISSLLPTTGSDQSGNMQNSLSVTSAGGMTGALIAGFSGQQESLIDFASTGDSAEQALVGFVGTGIANNHVEFFFSAYDFAAGSASLGSDLLEPTPNPDNSPFEASYYEGPENYVIERESNPNFESDIDFEFDFGGDNYFGGESDTGGESHFGELY